MLEWAITSSVLILVVLALRRLLIGKISLRLQYGLWALVLIRLLIPVSFGTTTVSVLNLVENTDVSNPILGYAGGNTPQLSVVAPAPSLPVEQQREQYEKNLEQWQAQIDAARAEEGTPVSTRMVLLGVWGTGAVVLGLWLLWVNVRFARKLRSSRPLAADCPLPVYVTGAAQTPCLFGLLHPSIYVTEEVAADETVLRHSLAHEFTHYRHRDHIWAALRGLCLAFHWYNPLVWVAAALSQRDGELCCDASTVHRLGEGERASYGRTLLAVTCQGHRNPLLTATSMTGSGNGIKERIVLLAKRPKTALYTLVVVILIAVIALGCTFTGAPKGALLEDAVLYELGDGLTLAIPADISEEILVEFPAEKQQEPNFPYVYHRDSYEAGIEDFGSPAGFLFKLFRESQVEYEQTYLAADGGAGQVIFARDDQWYYGMGVPTDLQFHIGSDEIDFSSREYQRWEYILSRITDIQTDFAARNGLTLFDATDDLDRPFLWEGNHRYVECRNADGTLFLTLLLSQPVKQGDGGIWCVEGSAEDKYDIWHKHLPPDIQIPAAEYYETLQAQVDEGHRPGLLDPIQTAMDWYRTTYDTEDLSDITFILLDGEASGPRLTSSDLDWDGEDEFICLEEQPGGYYELAVKELNGTELYREGIGTVYVGWNSLYLYRDSQNRDYLLSYTPYRMTGDSCYTYALFSLENGEKTVVQEGHLNFELHQVPELREDLIAFANEVNTLLRHSSLLLSIRDGKLVAGPLEFGSDLEDLSSLQEIWSTAPWTPGPNDASLPEEPIELLFASGAGGWGTTLTLSPDGSFAGEYSDAEMGGTPPTWYVCTFHGKFTDIQQTGPRTWSLTLADLKTDRPAGEVWTEEGSQYISDEAIGVAGGTKFTLYAPGTSAYDLTSVCRDWWPQAYLWRAGEQSTLDGWCLYNIETGESFFQW